MTQNQIYVGNLAYSVTEDDLNEFFAKYGSIETVKLVMDRETGRSKGFAFISFADQQAAQAALEANGADLKGRNMKVNPAKEGGTTGGRPGGNGGRGGRPGGNGGGRGGDGRSRW